jgi:hypothetical protein
MIIFCMLYKGSAYFSTKSIRFVSNLETTGCIFVQVLLDRRRCIMTAIINDKS